MRKTDNQRSDNSSGKGKLVLVGIGPGDTDLLTGRAAQRINACDVIVGYGRYVAQITPLIKDQEVLSTGMMHEIKRVRMAIDKAREGLNVCLVSGGDSGVYGMAGLALELLKDEDNVDYEVVPGVTACVSSAALLGAPLMHDYASISLSDRMTDRDLIMRRLKGAIENDFVVVIYNPRAKSRTEPFNEAAKILVGILPPDRPVGIVKNAFRKDEEVEIIQLGDLISKTEEIDMCTTLIVGNSATKIINGYMITPRGYPVNAERKAFCDNV